MPNSRVRIFAYGSNMHPQRMQDRVRSARPLGRALLSGHRFTCNKRGRDGSAKANLVASPDSEVWGVLWELSHEEVLELDRYEGGYERIVITVTHHSGNELESQAYLSQRLIDDPVPFDWYKACIVEGARAHDLPARYLALLEALPSRRDPNAGSD